MLLYSLDKKTSYTVEQNDFEGFFYSKHRKQLNTLKLLSTPSVSSTFNVQPANLHK